MRGFCFGFSFGALTTTSGSCVCALAAPQRSASATAQLRKPAQCTRRTRKHMTLHSTLACWKAWPKWPTRWQVCCRGCQKIKEKAALDPTAVAGVTARQSGGSATTGGQASGGARDWKKVRCGGKKASATRSKCSISREAKSAGNCGACGINEFSATEIVAQIAQ